jgi:cysteine desulfurase
MIYFDHNATTPIDDRVLEAMLPFLKGFYGNPSALYRHGRIVRSALETAREQIADLIAVTPSQVIFTSGGTEANNMALASVSPHSKLVISSIEHPSITEPALYLKNQGVHVDLMPVNGEGLITVSAIETTLKNKPDRISIMLANNETGVIQPLSDITDRFKEHNIIIHTDAVQALGKIPLSFNHLGVDLMSLSSHKIYGPKGVGALIFDKKTPLKALIQGGDQEQGLRAGTENVAGIIGFGKAAELAKKELSKRIEHLFTLRTQLERELLTFPGLTIFAQAAQRLPNTIQFGIPNMDGEMLLMNLDKKGIAVSSGSACASGSRLISPVLNAMHVDANLAKSAVRLSLGMHNTSSEVSEFIQQLKTLVYPI